MPYSVYTLSHPTTGNIFYVGVTLNLRTRLSYYTYKAIRAKFSAGKKLEEKEQHILSCKADPLFHVIEEVYGNYRLAFDREGFWIALLVHHGYPLANSQKRSNKRGYDINDLPLSFCPKQILTLDAKSKRTTNIQLSKSHFQ